MKTTSNCISEERDIAETYEKFLGFPRNEAEKFYRVCKDEIRFPEIKPGDKDRTLRILSIGTGYGRTDFPLIKAYIEHYEQSTPLTESTGPNEDMSNLTFHIDCIEPSLSFQEMLRGALDRDEYELFSNKDVLRTVSDEIYSISGMSTSKKSKIIINARPMKAEDYLNIYFQDDPRPDPLFHCIIAVLSLQFIPNTSMKRVFSQVLSLLCERGLIIVGEVCEEAAWLARKPPELLNRENVTDSHRRWFDLWSDWHKVLQDQGINRRLRLFLPHDFGLFRGTLERSSFISASSNESIDFIWENIIPKDLFHRIVEFIRKGKWKECVSSLYVEDTETMENKGVQILDAIKNENDPALTGAWRTEDRATLTNGIRLWVYCKARHFQDSDSYYGKILQDVILHQSTMTLEKQGLLEPTIKRIQREDERDEKENNKQSSEFFQTLVTSKLKQLTLSLKQHIELDTGSFVISMRVYPDKRTEAWISGTLIPPARNSNGKDRASMFFDGLIIPQKEPQIQYTRSWIWLYMLYLCVAKRMSHIAATLKKELELNDNFNIIITLDGTEESFRRSDSLMHLTLSKVRMQELRTHLWNIINEEPSKIAEVVDWGETEVVKRIETLWGEKSPLVRALRDGTELPEVFSLSASSDFVDTVKKTIFGTEFIQKIEDGFNQLFHTWAEKKTGIYLALKNLLADTKRPDEVKSLWMDFIAHFYLFSIELLEDGVNYLFHTPHGVADLDSVWGGFQIFLGKTESDCFIDLDPIPVLKSNFTAFIHPFDSVVYNDSILLPMLIANKEKNMKAGSEEMVGAFSHEVGKLSAYLTEVWLPELGSIFEIGDRKCDCWETPAGKIDVRKEHIEQISKWRIAYAPEALLNLKDLLFMWAGTRYLSKAMNFPDDQSWSTPQPIRDLVILLAEKDRGIVTARLALNWATPENAHRAITFCEEYYTALAIRPRIELKQDCDLLTMTTNKRSAPTAPILEALQYFFRAVMALFTNAIFHARSDTIIKADMKYKNDILSISTSNIPKDSEVNPKDPRFSMATIDVINICVANLDGKYIPSFYNPETNQCEARFSVSAFIANKKDKIRWIIPADS